MDVPTAEALAAPVRLDGMRPSGPLLDLPKLHSLSREFIASLTPDELYGQLLAWAEEYDPELGSVLARRRGLALAAVAAGPGPRARPPGRTWTAGPASATATASSSRSSSARHAAADDDRYGGLAPDLVRRIAGEFAREGSGATASEEWYGALRALAARHGRAPDTASWRRDPGRWAGPPREVANVVRVALTGATRSPDLFAVARALGRAEVLRRLTAVAG